ncbi:MAG TPA: hypothetical protein VKB14_09675 [Actinomycetales bacterium]|nr:hypothetical protein [Actinomycetales bacterium]
MSEPRAAVTPIVCELTGAGARRRSRPWSSVVVGLAVAVPVAVVAVPVAVPWLPWSSVVVALAVPVAWLPWSSVVVAVPVPVPVPP